MRRTLRAFAISAALSLGLALPGLASTVTTFGPEDLIGINDGGNTAIVTLEYDGVNTLTVSLENTADFEALVTGFALNAADGVTGISAFSASGFAGADQWDAFFDPDDVSSPENAGFFDVGAVSESGNGANADGNTIQDCLNNGDCNITSGFPGNAIETGETGTFVFTLLGDATTLAGLTAESFWTEAAEENGAAFNFAARFQQTGSDGQGSDVAVNGGDIPPVPLPAAGWLMLAGVGGLVAMRRRRKAA